jgi:hypothetical protein
MRVAEPAVVTGEAALDRQRAAVLTPRTAAAALAGGLLAALLIPGARAGLGLSVAAVTLLVAGASGRAGARHDAWGVVCLSVAAALAATPFYRDATWLVAGDLVLAFSLTAIVLGAGRSWRALLIAPVSLAGRMVEGPMTVIRGMLDVVPRPSEGAALPALRGAVLAAGLVTVFGLLFASADGAFAHIIGKLAPNPPTLGNLPERLLVAVLALALAGGLALVAARGVPEGEARSVKRTLPPLEWGLALGSVVALFMGFVAIQFVVLFGGHAHVLHTSGLTYAEYARQGFGQLLVVAVLAISLVGAAWRWSRIERERDRRLLRILLGAICLLTMVIVAAALHRLDLYVDAFGATRLRLEAAVACAWIGALLVLVLVGVLSATRAWLARAVVLVSALFALGFTLTDPEAWIAARNVDRYEQMGGFDGRYNASLSADATPELARLPPALAGRVLDEQRDRLATADGLRGFNLARERARNALD